MTGETMKNENLKTAHSANMPKFAPFYTMITVDGKNETHKVIMFGDEFSVHYETPDGYTLV
jgi:hypothetical protein